jgi:hypothetical protein
MSRRATAMLAVLALAGAVIVGCGSGSDSGGSADGGDMASGAPQGATQGFQKLEACLKRHGVEVPDRGSRGGPPDGTPPSGQAPSAKAKKAFEACRDELPEGLGPPPGGATPPNFDQGGSTPGVQRQ